MREILNADSTLGTFLLHLLFLMLLTGAGTEQTGLDQSHGMKRIQK